MHDSTGEITDDDVAKLKALYESRRVAYCASAKRLPLSFTKPAQFKRFVGVRGETAAQGVPSLFEDADLYENPKAAIMEDVFKGIVESLKSSGSFHPRLNLDGRKECAMRRSTCWRCTTSRWGNAPPRRRDSPRRSNSSRRPSMDASCVEALNKASFWAPPTTFKAPRCCEDAQARSR